jgi:hypothetical protein
MPFGRPVSDFPKVHGSDVRETFADSMGDVMFDGQILRMEFCVTRLEELKPPAAPAGQRHIVSRIALTTEGAVQLMNAAQQIAAALKQAGILKETPGLAGAPAAGPKN